MSYWDKKLVRQQIDEKLAPLKQFADSGIPPAGWIRTIREALGMTTQQMADRTGFDQPRISRLERAEKDGNLRLSSLQKIARGLGMRFVYGFVGEKTLEQLVRDQAQKIALKRLERLDKTMVLELQGLPEEEKQKAIKDLIDKILVEEPKDFWNE